MNESSEISNAAQSAQNAVTMPQSHVIAYTYDATEMRTSKAVNGVEKKFYYDGMYILNEGDGAEITATNFIGLTGIEGGKNGADEMAFFMKDAHGDVVKVLDSEDFRADYEYDIWGNQTQETTNTFDNPFRYCSEYMDEESGLIYLRARYYDPGTGRFTQEDPAKDGLNWYIYCYNNSITYTDPSGMDVYYFVAPDFVGDTYFDQYLLEQKFNEPVHILAVNTADEFIAEWNAMGNWDGQNVNVSAVILNLHGNQMNIATTSDGSQRINMDKMIPKNIGTILLLACNSGHLDFRFASPAYKLLTNNNVNNVIAADGTVATTWHGLLLESRRTEYFVKNDKYFRYGMAPNDVRTPAGFVNYYIDGNGILQYTELGINFANINNIFNAAGVYDKPNPAEFWPSPN